MLAANACFSFFSLDLFSCSCFHQEQWKDVHATTGRLPKPTAALRVCCQAVGLQSACEAHAHTKKQKKLMKKNVK